MLDKVINLNKMSIIISERSHDYTAQLMSNPGIWGLGRNEKEAIGDLIVTMNSFNLS
jgi:hypothetical protein